MGKFGFVPHIYGKSFIDRGSRGGKRGGSRTGLLDILDIYNIYLDTDLHGLKGDRIQNPGEFCHRDIEGTEKFPPPVGDHESTRIFTARPKGRNQRELFAYECFSALCDSS
jgi:hypothetical protein